MENQYCVRFYSIGKSGKDEPGSVLMVGTHEECASFQKDTGRPKQYRIEKTNYKPEELEPVSVFWY